MDLFDEAGEQLAQKVTTNVRELGGDLFDESGIVNKDPSMLSEKINNTPMDDNLHKVMDDLNNNLSGMERFLVGAGRGMTTIARAVGLAEPEDPVVTESFNRLSDDSFATQAGEVIGEAAPFLAAAPLAGAGLTTQAGTRIIPAAQSMLGKVMGATVLGATEGGAIVKGKGGELSDIVAGAGVGGTIGGIIEAVSPVLGRLGGALWKQLKGKEPDGPLLTPDGAPTPEFEQVLRDTGTSFEDLSREAFAEVNKQGVDPATAARTARFESQGIPATKGDVTQDFAQQSQESRLMSQASATAGEPLRDLKLKQSEAFQAKVTEMVNELGVPGDAGDSIKEALVSRKSLLRKERQDLYKQAFDASPEVKNLPLFTDDIRKALPDSDTLEDLAITAPDAVKQVQAAMSRFGMGDEIDGQQLTIGNYDRLRKILGNIERSDQSGAAKVMTVPLKKALDAEADLAIDKVATTAADSAAVTDVISKVRDTVGDGRKLPVRVVDSGDGIDIVSRNGKMELEQVADGEFMVATSLIKEGARGKGEGLGLYLSAMEEAQKRGGKEFTSGNNVSDDASRVWESLQRRGLPVVKNDNAVRVVDSDGVGRWEVSDEVDSVYSLSLDKLDNPGTNAVDDLKKARSIVRQEKTEFSKESIVGKLVGVKRDGVTPVTQSSKVTRKLLTPTAPIEDLRTTLSSLRKAGPKGTKAIKDMQASVVMNALEDALKAPSRKTNGMQTIGGNAFAKSLTSMGDDKLALLFKGDEKSLKRLMNYKQTALDMTPTAGATPKGSAPIILDIMTKASAFPGLVHVRDAVHYVLNAGTDERAVRKALDAKPVFKRAISALEKDFPAIAASLGVAATVPNPNKNEE